MHNSPGKHNKTKNIYSGENQRIIQTLGMEIPVMYLMGQFRNTTSLFHCEKVVIDVLTNQNIHKKIQSHKQNITNLFSKKTENLSFYG